MAEGFYNVGKTTVANTDLDTADLRMILFSAWTSGGEDPDLATISALLAVGGVTEAAFTNYVRKSLASVTITTNNTADRSEIDAADVVWTSAGGAANETPAAAVIYLHVGADSSNLPISFHTTNFGVQATNGQNFTVQIATAAQLN